MAVIFLGNYIDEVVMQARGIPARNAAGSNRILRLAMAIHAATEQVVILSPATSLASRGIGPFMQPEEWRSAQGVPVCFTAAVRDGRLNLFYKVFALANVLRKLRKRGFDAIVIYNYAPHLLTLALFGKFLLGFKLIHNVEDIALPRWRDWFSQSEVRPLQELLYFPCMIAIALLADLFVLPTSKFKRYLPIFGRKVLIEPGCIDVIQSSAQTDEGESLRILFGGKLEFEHGLDVLFEALERLPPTISVEVDICGAGPHSRWIKDRIEKLETVKVRYHGFVTDNTYVELLRKSQLCISLQKPHGRYGDLKTPSKVFEYLGRGKPTVSSKVGDIGAIPEGAIILCEPCTAEELAKIIVRFAREREALEVTGAKALSYASEAFSYRQVGLRLLRAIHPRH